MASFYCSRQMIASSNIKKWIAWFRNYFPSMIIWALVLSHSIVEYATVCILMLFLTNELDKELLLASIIINVLDGLSAVFIFPFAYIGDHFNVIVFSTGSYTMGLILLWIIAQHPTESSMIYLALVLIALGKSGRSSSLQYFLGYQLRERNNLEHANSGNSGEQRQMRDVGTKIWWHSAWISGYAIAIFAKYDYDSFLNFEISALLMGATCLLFYLGFMVYDHEKPARMSLAHILRVFKPAKPVNLLLWATFIPYSLVLATGNTLFIAQVNNLDTHIGNNFRVRYSFLFVVKSFTCDLVVFLFWYWGRSTRVKHTLVRIGAGIICAAFCCVAAQQVEILRHHSISSKSVLLLTPQYCLLGLMEGLAGGGLFRYILGHVPAWSRRSFAKPFSELVLCVGKFLSIPFMLIFRSWFHENRGFQSQSVSPYADTTVQPPQPVIAKLDIYFLVLAILSCVFFCMYLVWVLSYGYSVTYLQNEESENMTYGEPVQQEEPGDQADEEAHLESVPEETPDIQDSGEEILQE